MFLTSTHGPIYVVGDAFIHYIGDVMVWLTSNFIGSFYMFAILCVLFMVIFSLGGHNK